MIGREGAGTPVGRLTVDCTSVTHSHCHRSAMVPRYVGICLGSVGVGALEYPAEDAVGLTQTASSNRRVTDVLIGRSASRPTTAHGGLSCYFPGTRMTRGRRVL